ncbi:MAG: type II toxin-antitoxin system death-on-curing family toxin [Hyphococcus sp.]
MTWRWIPKDTVFGIHTKSIAAFGGSGGVRDEGLLDSALARPENLAAYGEPSVFELAASYGFGLVRNHPFIDGNKRTAFLTTALFMRLSGFALTASEPEATATMLAFAAGEVSEAEFALWLKANSQKL